MKDLWQRLLTDETGVIVSSELALVGTVGVLGMVVGLEAVSTAVTQELTDLSNAYRAIDQSYSYRSISKGAHARFSGSGFTNVSGGGALGTADVNGQQGSSANSQTVFGNSGNSIQLLQGRAIENFVEETPVSIRSIEEACPEDDIIEEHVIRRRVKANSAATLRDDCEKSSQISVFKKGTNTDAKVNSTPSRSAPEKFETKPKKNN